MTPQDKKPLMRCIGEFFGHIIRAVRQDVSTSGRGGASEDSDRRVIEASRREERRGDVIVRETRIREVEFRNDE